MNDSYLTLSEKSTTEIKIQRSRFVANAFPIESKEDALHKLDLIKKEYFDARHNPFAYILFANDIFRYNDDGEPSGSSGKPIYDALNKYNLKNVITIVTRYFGGIKLGVGGLKRAYFEATDLCLQNSKILEIILKEKIILNFDYSMISSVMNYLEKNKINILENNSKETVSLVCDVRLSLIDKFKIDLIELTNGKLKF